jgi:ferredoxin
VEVVVAEEACIGAGMCVGIAPDIFEIGHDGIVTVRKRVERADEAAVLDAIDCCPAEALSAHAS